MKVYLDDIRPTPVGWIHAFWPSEVIDFLKTGQVDELSLDHDLGDDDRGTGYDVLLWIEEQVFTNNFTPPKISIHSANISARKKMQMAIYSIENK